MLISAHHFTLSLYELTYSYIQANVQSAVQRETADVTEQR